MNAEELLKYRRVLFFHEVKMPEFFQKRNVKSSKILLILQKCLTNNTLEYEK